MQMQREMVGGEPYDFVPLGEYVVRAVGDPASLQAHFETGEAGRALTAYAAANGLALQVTRADDLRLPAGSAQSLTAGGR